MTTPFTYYLRHKPTGKKYYGVKFAKDCHPDDLWQNYFTSSRAVHSLIEEYGPESFEYEIRRVFKTPEQAIEWEGKVLERLDVCKKSDWLNKNVRGGIVHTEESLERMRASLKKRYAMQGSKLKGRKHSDETRKKMSEARKGKPSPNKGKVCPETAKQAKRNKQKGRIVEVSTKKLLSDSASRRRRVYNDDGSWRWVFLSTKY